MADRAHVHLVSPAPWLPAWGWRREDGGGGVGGEHSLDHCSCWGVVVTSRTMTGWGSGGGGVVTHTLSGDCQPACVRRCCQGRMAGPSPPLNLHPSTLMKQRGFWRSALHLLLSPCHRHRDDIRQHKPAGTIYRFELKHFRKYTFLLSRRSIWTLWYQSTQHKNKKSLLKHMKTAPCTVLPKSWVFWFCFPCEASPHYTEQLTSSYTALQSFSTAYSSYFHNINTPTVVPYCIRHSKLLASHQSEPDVIDGTCVCYNLISRDRKTFSACVKKRTAQHFCWFSKRVRMLYNRSQVKSNKCHLYGTKSWVISKLSSHRAGLDSSLQ